MSDLELRRGMRILLSGGGVQLSTEELKNIRSVVDKILDERRISNLTAHFQTPKGVACGAFFYDENAVNRKKTNEVTCKKCRRSRAFKAAIGEIETPKEVIHFRARMQNPEYPDDIEAFVKENSGKREAEEAAKDVKR